MQTHLSDYLPTKEPLVSCLLYKIYIDDFVHHYGLGYYPTDLDLDRIHHSESRMAVLAIVRVLFTEGESFQSSYRTNHPNHSSFFLKGRQGLEQLTCHGHQDPPHSLTVQDPCPTSSLPRNQTPALHKSLSHHL